MDCALYLRKSRVEEGMETEEILSRHQKTLLDHAKRQGLHILETYFEVVSGESLYARPQMLRLLEDVESGKYDAVLVMDLDRLSRGRMKDQGMILDAFRDSDTLIITPDKTYNLSDDLDDEMAEFKTFMSRREYKIINKRLRRGLQQSISDGFHVANPPYGYRRVFIERRPTLEIVEEEARFVRMMFSMYVEGHGCVSIANQVNLLGARPHRVDRFGRSSVANILRNPTYIGKIVWNKKKHIKKGSKGNPKHIVIYHPKEEWLVVDGAHPPIVSQELFEKAKAIMDGRYIPSRQDGTVKSPMAGLIRCRNCGRNMQRLNMKKAPYLYCLEPGCCASTQYDLVEKRLLQHLGERLEDLRVQQAEGGPRPETADMDEMITAIRRERSVAESQKARLYDLLEMGEYDLETFRERMVIVREKIAGLEKAEAELRATVARVLDTDIAAQIQKITSVLNSYWDAEAPERNALLHSVLDTVWYHKEKKTKPTAFLLQLELKPF